MTEMMCVCVMGFFLPSLLSLLCYMISIYVFWTYKLQQSITTGRTDVSLYLKKNELFHIIYSRFYSQYDSSKSSDMNLGFFPPNPNHI